MSSILRSLSDLSFLELLAAAVDILIVYYLIYRTMLLLRGTRAIQMLVGIVFALALFLLSQEILLNLTTVNWILEKFVSSFILVLIVLFAPDIRRALSEVGKNPLFVGIARHGTPSLYDEVIRAVTRLSSKRIGALIVLAREADLTSYTEEAIALDARVTAETLFSIFIPSHENPLHDGAVIISEGRISHAACFLPLTENPTLDKSLGTRHRAGVGITESTDAVVIIVSEETGIISLAENGVLKRNLDGNTLRSELLRFFGPKARKEHDG